MTTDWKLVTCILGAILCGVLAVNLPMPGWATGLLLLTMGWLFTVGAWFKVKSLSDEHDLPYYLIYILAIGFTGMLFFLTAFILYLAVHG